MTIPERETRGSRAGARVLGVAVIAVVWLVIVAMVGLFATEWFLEGEKSRRLDAVPRFGAVWEAYAPFRELHLSPFYLFFFPQDPETRLATGNDMVSIGAEGFRGPGPEAANGRKLAFILGGSSAFGNYTSSNDTTISGWLNRLQDEYHVVNAGVPSWNSTQELFRMVRQITKYDPDLVIAYDGANDAGHLYRYETWGFDYEPGTPENFELLEAFVPNLKRGGNLSSLPTRFFPRIQREFRKFQRHPVRDGAIERAAREYAHNLEVMRDVAEARGARFIAIFQPVLALHENMSGADRKWRRVPTLRKFHDLVMGRHRPDVEFYDFASFFDSRYDRVPSIDPEKGEDLTDETVFVDQVHVSDLGNRQIAEGILPLLGPGPAAP